ncbi:MAG: hypothetical protein M1514_03865 [Patescibacteria group bacterium]|nr:hypothetical protein [Patescibacteria group bacterium]
MSNALVAKVKELKKGIGILCPKCNEEMEITKKDISHDFKKKKEYNRMIYICRKDDVWVTIEVPQNTAN